MAKLKEILDAESQRSTLEQCRVIHLFQEGTFYRAYEWSAWLCVRYIQDFKATKRKFKNEDAPVAVGSSQRPGRLTDVMHQILAYPIEQKSPLESMQFLADLYEAYYDARKHKRNKGYQLRFEARLAENLEELCDELYTRTYRPLPSSCFVITNPKKREVFAAEFRDRVVHHLYYNYTYKMFERTFIHDTYSCLAGRWTHWQNYRLRRRMLTMERAFMDFGMFNSSYTKYEMLSIRNRSARCQNRNRAV